MQSADEELEAFLPILEKHFYPQILPMGLWPNYATGDTLRAVVQFDNVKVGRILADNLKLNKTPSMSALAEALVFSSRQHEYVLLCGGCGMLSLYIYEPDSSEPDPRLSMLDRNCSGAKASTPETTPEIVGGEVAKKVLTTNPNIHTTFENHLWLSFDRALEEYRIYVRRSGAHEPGSSEIANRQQSPQKTIKPRKPSPKGFKGLEALEPGLGLKEWGHVLTEKQYDVYRMICDYRLSVAETARRMGISRPVVDKQFAACKKRIKEYVENNKSEATKLAEILLKEKIKLDSDGDFD
jgi:hypothetical protein